MDLPQEDLEALAQIGQALWPDARRAARVASETLSAVSTLTLEPGLVVDRTGVALVQRAGREGVPPAAKIQHSFYRLNTDERAALAALHLGKWTYTRAARLIGVTSDALAELVWAARLELVAGSEGGAAIPHPVGSGRARADCPEYNPRKPWTQTFLDNELAATDRMFLQNHLLVCTGCRQSLQAARRVFFAAETRVPRATELDARCRDLRESARRAELQREPGSYSFSESIVAFLSRKGVLNTLVLAGIIFFFYAKTR